MAETARLSTDPASTGVTSGVLFGISLREERVSAPANDAEDDGIAADLRTDSAAGFQRVQACRTDPRRIACAGGGVHAAGGCHRMMGRTPAKKAAIGIDGGSGQIPFGSWPPNHRLKTVSYF